MHGHFRFRSFPLRIRSFRFPFFTETNVYLQLDMATKHSSSTVHSHPKVHDRSLNIVLRIDLNINRIIPTKISLKHSYFDYIHFAYFISNSPTHNLRSIPDENWFGKTSTTKFTAACKSLRITSFRNTSGSVLLACFLPWALPRNLIK